MAKKALNFSIYIPIKVTPEDAIALDRAAELKQASRSEVIRGLIRSLNMQPNIEKAAD
jgi:metal-responsive CopG/Arc/MetJ family transcriptional regulator